MVALTTKVLFASCLVLSIGIYFYPRDDDHFEYFYLALQWPASLCNNTGPNKCFLRAPEYFTIHGLWAQKKNHESYNCHTPNAFNFSKLKEDEELVKIMRESWRSLVEMDQDMLFWKHEWEKHGMCTFKSHQNEYFNKTNAMWRKASLLEVFEAKNITPGDRTYLLKEYNDAIEAKLGVKPGRFNCNKNKNGTKQLVQVRLCTDKKVTKFVNCTAPEPKKYPSCGKVDDQVQIAFPSWNEDDEVLTTRESPA